MSRPRIIGALIVAILVEANIAVPAIQQDVVFYNDAVVTSDERYDSVTIYDSPPETTTIDFYGQAQSLTMYDLSVLNVHNGSCFWQERSVQSELHDSSTLNVYEGGGFYGGSGGILRAYDFSTLNINAGLIYSLLAIYDSSTVNLYNGSLGMLAGISDNSILNVYGGSIGVFLSNISLPPTATVNIYGYGFEYNAYGKWMLPIPDGEDGRWVSKLAGYGLEGDPITIWGLPDPTTHDNINLVPEPTAVVLLGLAGLGLLRIRGKPGRTKANLIV